MSKSGSGEIMDLPADLSGVSAYSCIWVAFSGGLDSTVLLHWLSNKSLKHVRAVHVHHGLMPDADAWVRHCEKICTEYSIPLKVLHVEVTEVENLGTEAAARVARYAALSELLTDNDVLLTAHHADDQAETLLLQLLRGSGPHGLAAMPVLTELGAGKLLRPLLSVSRSELLAYAQAYELEWVDDPSNEDTELRRNFIRHEVSPLLGKQWPEYRENLQRSAGLQAEAASLLDDLASQDLAMCKGSIPHALSIQALTSQREERRRNVIRYWLRQLGLEVPNQAHMDRIEGDMLFCREDANPVVNWANVEMRRYRDDLVAMAALPSPPGSVMLDWDLNQPLQLPDGCGELVAERAQGAGLRLEKPNLKVGFNQEAERIRPVFSKHHKRLKHLFQETGVPTWVRERLPLIYHGHSLVAVADHWLAAEYVAEQHEQGWRLHWRNAPLGWPITEKQAVPDGE